MKNKGKNKFLAFGIILCMLFGLAVVPVGAETEGYYTYFVEDDMAIITEADNSIRGYVYIPSTLGGYPVRHISDYAFEDCTNVIYINIPYGVMTIGMRAFSRCSNLTSITIPNSVKYIDFGAFRVCSNLTSITIPDSVTSVGDCAFGYCSSLTSITISNSLTSISGSAFEGCENLSSITIPDSVTSIEEGAFCYCINLSSITIPDSVTSITEGAFRGCGNLADVYYSGTAEDWNNISIGEDNNCLTNATIHYNHIQSKALAEQKNYGGDALTLLENGVLDIGENLYLRNGYVNAENGHIKAGDKKITGERIYFTNSGKMRLDNGYTAKVERDNGDGTTSQGFMVGLTNPNGVVNMTLEITGEANGTDYTGRTISKEFDFTACEIEGLLNFGFTVNNIPKPLSLSIQSIE